MNWEFLFIHLFCSADKLHDNHEQVVFYSADFFGLSERGT